MLLSRTRSSGTRVLKSRLAAMLVALSAFVWIAGRSPKWVALAAPAPGRTALPPVLPVAPLPHVSEAPSGHPVLAQVRTTPSVQPAPTAAPSVTAVSIPVVVLDSQGTPVADLTQGDFQVSDLGVVQTLTSFEQRAQANPAGILLMVHDSSMKQVWQEALAKASAPFDASAVSSIFLDQPGTDREALLEMSIASINRLAQNPAEQKIMLVLSDTPSDFDQLLRDNTALNRAILSAGVKVFPLSVSTPAELETMKFPQRTTVPTYFLRYSPSGVASTSGAFHRVVVSVDRPDLRVQARSGYFPGQN